jgi:DnaJ-class molecular chaperone
MTKQEPTRRDTYWKRCTNCNGLGWKERVSSTGKIYRQSCNICNGRGGAETPVGQ